MFFTVILSQLIKDKTLREKIGKNGQSIVAKERSWEKIANKIEAIYDNVLLKK